MPADTGVTGSGPHPPDGISAGRQEGPSPSGSRRFPFIDVLRGLAVLFMIETHTVNALLDPGIGRGVVHQSLTFLNGLVAPAFLFCAGLGFSIFLERKNEAVIRFGGSFREYGRKILFILLLGYSLHAPVYSLGGIVAGGAPAWKEFFQVDIPQVIALPLLILLLLVTVLRTRIGRLAGVSVLTLLTLVLSLFLGGGGVPGLPVWLQAYFSREVSPLFTLFPWAAFLTCGYLAGHLFTGASARGSEKSLMSVIAAGSAIGLTAAVAVSGATYHLYPPGAYWHSGIEFFCIRLSVILLVMTALWRFFQTARAGVSNPLVLFGRESLPVYYLHLMIVYGRDLRFSFINVFPRELNYGECFALALSLALLMWGFASVWNRLKKSRPLLSRIAVRVLVVSSVLVFFFS